jgi:glyoxylase-like metal-dependent hydrolase (beta-lactamase superfamily II)
MKVEMFNAGWLTAAAGVWRRGDDLDRTVRFPVPVYVVEAGAHRVLIDTGLHPSAAADAQAYYERPEVTDLFALDLDLNVAERVNVTTITHVVLTHLHFDHAGGLALLPASIPVLVQRREWEAGHDSMAIKRNGYFPIDFDEPAREVVLVDGDRDVFGDGAITLMLTPGHTPGHQSVRIGDDLVLGGDATYFASGLDDHRFPVYGDDYEQQARSADRLRALRDAGVRVMPGHDPDVLRPGLIAIDQTSAERRSDASN